MSELGSGSYSVIYRAFDHENQTEVAIKMEKPERSRSILISEYACLLRLKGR
jgi:hypothetical protein